MMGKLIDMQAAAEREQQARTLAASFGARIYPFGRAWRVVGPSVDILIHDLRYLRREDFKPGWPVA
ncbi:MAG: hypothetical protein M9907_19255 [Burkholderiaceae bacterium]|nr:hypothetical protein [Burkholderiaceae bacterium]